MEVHASTVSIVAPFTVRMLSEFKVGIVVRQVGELHRVVVIVLGIQIAPNDHSWLEFLGPLHDIQLCEAWWTS